MSGSPRDGSAMLAALPIAAAATLAAARFLPVRFEYRPNDLGIVSLATERSYPQQQEIFWLLFALLFGSALALSVARWLAREGLAPRRWLGVEVCGAASLAALLFLPQSAGLAMGLAAVGLARVAAGARMPPGASIEAPAAIPHPPPRSRCGVALAWGAGLLALAVGLTPGFLVNAWNVATGVADELRTQGGFVFHGEIGQHLAWADALRRGHFHGRDFFCLYGPLYDLGATGFWALVGRSIAAWEFYFGVTRALGLAALLWLAAFLCRRPVFALAIPFLVPWVNLRIGLALGALMLLFAWLRSGRRRHAAAAGCALGVGLLYSQEFGLAAAATGALAFAIRRDLRAALACFGAAAATMAPLLVWYAANGALGPMLRDLVAYPGIVLAGFGKLPFPSLVASLPLEIGEPDAARSLLVRLGYVAPTLAWGAVLLALPVAGADLRRPVASASRMLDALRADPARTSTLLCGVFGLLCFRTALGRSDLAHVVAALPPAALLVVLAADRLWSDWRDGRVAGMVVAWRALALALLVTVAGITAAPRPLRELARQASDAAALRRGDHQPVGSREVMRVVRWLQLRAEPTDAILFLPNDAAYYYLLDRPSPIRFVMGHQIATDADRAEVLATLRASPPRFLVWDDGALRVDGLPDERVFGAEILRWLDESYVEVSRLGEISIRERRAPGAQP